MKNALVLMLVLAAYAYTGHHDYAQESAEMQTTNLKATAVVEDDNGAEVQVQILFDYQPYERQTRDYPGCRADIMNITALDEHGNEHHASGDTRRDEDIEAACWEHVEKMLSTAIDRRPATYKF